MAKKKVWQPFWLEREGTWAVDFRVQGQRIRRRLPVSDRKLKGLARNLALQMYREAWQDALEQNSQVENVTFREAARLYVEAGGEARFLPRIVDHFGPNLPAGEIDAIKIAKAAEAIYSSAKPETVRRQLKVPIRAVQNFAIGKRREKSPDTVRVRWLTPEEAEGLLLAAAAPSAADLRDPDLQTLRKIAFMLGTGAGPGETMALPVEGWNPATREWWLPGTKSVFRARYVVLPERTINLISPLRTSGMAFVAPNGEPYVMSENRGGQMAAAFAKVRAAAGLSEDVVPYTLRHTWATWFYAQTKDWGALLDQGGWGRSDTANRYRKIAPADLGNRLLAHGWDFRQNPGPPVKFGELISV